MADNTINVRIKQKIDTESNWSKNNPILLKGEKGLIEGTSKYKIGDGTSKWSDLPLYEGMTASDRSKLNSIASGATKVTVDSTLSSTSTNPVQNKVINSALAGKSNTNHTHDLSTMINTLSTGTATPTDDDYYVSQYSSGGTTTTTYHRRPMKALFEYIKGKLSTVAASGSYNDLSNKPTIPTVGNGTVTIKQAGTSKGTFTMNQSGNTTIELTDNNTTYPTGTSSTSGLTKLYTGTGTATDGTMTQAAIKGVLDGKSDTSHTHDQIVNGSYGASVSSDGYVLPVGNSWIGKQGKPWNTAYITNVHGTADTATTATKLSSSAGSANQPVYFSDGKPVAGTYTIAKSVPSDAKFTDTVYTHPTYTAKASGLYKVTVDATGHVSATAAVTKADITGLGIPGTDTNTDTKVTQNAVKDSDYTNWRSLVWGSSNSATEGFTPTTVTDQLFSSTNLSVQPSTGTIKAKTFKGSLNGTATNASKVNNHTVNSDVPSGAKFTDTVYTHPTTSGNKHIPSGGSAGQILRWSADGTAVWGADNNTTYNDATTSAHGLMTAAMVTKLNGIATNANNYSLPTASSSTLGGVKTTSTVTDTSGYSPCPIVSGVPYYRNPLAQKEYTLSNISGTLAVSKGGTGATSASTGRANLGAVNFVCQKTEPEDGDQNVGDLWFAEE